MKTPNQHQGQRDVAWERMRQLSWYFVCATVLLGFACLLALGATPVCAQIRNLQELNATDIQGLDLQRTVVIIPGGILEEHGPYLPSFTDGYVNEYLSRHVAEAVVARPGWTVLLFTVIPLGDGGANQVGKKQVFAGTYHVHFSTLRAVFMDVASELGEAGFRWVFVVSAHGALRHQQALDQASDFFTDAYGGKMVHLTGLVPTSPTPSILNLTDAERQQNGLDVHAGMTETSEMLFLRPELVAPGYRHAQPQSGSSWRELVDLGMRPGWPGYFGAPALATAARGAAILRSQSQDFAKLALRILDGFDYRTLQRRADQQLTDEAIKDCNAAADEHARTVQVKQLAWLRAKGL